MKSVAVIVAVGLFATVQAQSDCTSLVAKIPSCATECIASAASTVGCSSVTDLACQCKNTEAINSAALNCVLKSCGAEKGLVVQSAAAAVCSCVASSGSGSGSGSSPAPSSAAAPASESEAESTPGPAPTKESPSLPVTSAAAPSSAAPYPTSQPQVSQITDGQVQASGAASPSAALPGNSTVPFTGAGAKVVVSIGSLLVALGAAAAAL